MIGVAHDTERCEIFEGGEKGEEIIVLVVEKLYVCFFGPGEAKLGDLYIGAEEFETRGFGKSLGVPCERLECRNVAKSGEEIPILLV